MRAALREAWRFSDQCGLPYSKAERVDDMLSLELSYYCSDPMLALTITMQAQGWNETRNPFCIDYAVHLCDRSDTPIPAVLAELIADVARCRLNGTVQGGTPGVIKRKAAQSHALTFMANLRAVGLTLEASASKAAAMSLREEFPARYTASTLQKLYTQEWRALEGKLREHFKSEAGVAQLAGWRRLIPQLPDAPPELIGDRR